LKLISNIYLFFLKKRKEKRELFKTLKKFMKLSSIILLLSLFAHYSHGWWVTLPAHQDGCFGSTLSGYHFQTETENSWSGDGIPKVNFFSDEFSVLFIFFKFFIFIWIGRLLCIFNHTIFLYILVTWSSTWRVLFLPKSSKWTWFLF